jgi:hypothetical protein
VAAVAAAVAHADDTPVAKEPGAEPNPYDIKLEDEAAKPAKAVAQPTGLEASGKDSDPSGSGSNSPGF